MFGGVLEGLLQIVRTAGIGVSDYETIRIETGLVVDAERMTPPPNNLPSQSLVLKRPSRSRSAGIDVGERLGDHADDGRNLGYA